MKGYIFGALLFLSGITVKAQSTHNRLQTTLKHLNKALSESEKQYAKKLGNPHTAEFYRDDAVYLLQDGKTLKMPIDSLYDEKKWSSYRVEIAFDLYDPSIVSAAYFGRGLILLSPLSGERKGKFDKKRDAYQKLFKKP
ncbi:MAG: hypothetical protein EOO20_09195 [Chryseobacterium sp.]|nr:MAG: hypothetical protein EOO20_09195 [Chryseobacterium sp.]